MRAIALHLPINMKLKTKAVRQTAQVSNNLTITKKYQTIKLGIDWHAQEYRVVRLIDDSNPEPAQRFKPAAFLSWVTKQLTQAQKVYSCYEAGAGGFVLHRQLIALGVINYVVVPRKLDPQNQRVRNDQRDAAHLAQNLNLYVRGNHKAMSLVHVPSPEQEQRRQQSRHRQALQKDRLALASRGRCLLLCQGWIESNQWWKPSRWDRLRPHLPPWLVQELEIDRQLILAIDDKHREVVKAVEACASGDRPVGMGALSWEEINREVCDWHRFKNRKQPGAYTGLTGGVESSGDYRCDLPITKAGNIRLRVLLIELAWRMVRYQSQCPLIQRWRRVLLNPKPNKRARKRAIVAVARQLMTELWRWQTDLTTPKRLGWIMVADKQGQSQS